MGCPELSRRKGPGGVKCLRFQLTLTTLETDEEQVYERARSRSQWAGFTTTAGSFLVTGGGEDRSYLCSLWPGWLKVSAMAM